MSNVLRIAIVDPDDHSRDTLKAILLSMETVWLEADCSRYEFFPDIVEQTTPDVGIVTLDSDEQKATDLLQRLSRDFHETILLAASSSTDGQLILRAMRSGAKEFLTLPLSDDELSEALGRISASRFGDENKKSRSCQTIAVCGVTGGVGTTSIATNMGAMLAATEDSSVALVDLDLALGDADVFLDAIPDYTLADVTQNISRLDIQLLKRSLTKHASGLYLLPRPVDLHDTTLIDEDNFLKVIALLKASFSHLIIDLSKTYNLVDLVVLKNADHIILVTQLDLPCLRNIVRLMMSFEEIEGLVDRVKIVVNRAGLDSGQISLKKAKETIGREIFAQLPNDYRTMVDVRNNGVPLITQAPKAGVTQAMQAMVDRLEAGELEPVEAMDAETEGSSSGAGWARFWPGKKGS